jgi:plastocyanin
MRRLAVAALVVVAGAGPANATAPPPARLQVAAKEFSLTLSRAKLKPGWAIVELANYGEDPHDLRLRRIGGTVTRTIAIVQAGDQRSLRVNLLPGRYRLWCSLPDHAARGMQAQLVVTTTSRR